MKHTKDFEITAIVPDTYLLTSKDGHIITIEEAMANEKLFEIATEMYNMICELNELIERIDMRSSYDPYPIQLKAKELIKKAS